MKNFCVLFILIFLFALNCLAQCDGLDTFASDSFFSARNREKLSVERKKEREKEREKVAKQKKQSSATTERAEPVSGTFVIDSWNGDDPESYPLETLTFGTGFSEGLAKISVNGKSGFINANGQVVVEPKYTAVNCFSENLAPVEIKNKWGYINKIGQIVIPATFDFVAPFSENVALVKVGKLWGYIDHNGQIVIEPKFEDAKSFSEGYAAIQYYDKDYVWKTDKKPNGKWRQNFIDKEGKLKFSDDFDGISRNFDGGMAIVSRSLGYSEKYKGSISETYVIDTRGNELWKLNSWYISWFSNDLIVVAVGKDDEGKNAYSFIDRNGTRVSDKTFAGISEFSEGLACAKVTWGGKYGFINKNGDFVIEPKFDSCDSFSEGLSGAKELYVGAKNKYGYIDKSGQFVIKPQFDWVDEFTDGFALVAIGDKIGYIDKTGKYIWKPTK